MKVSLVSYTQDAVELLIFTKSTRLTMSPGLLGEIKGWSAEKKQAELDYMRGTIQSSWEFVDFVFLIEGVSRAFTHQLVRHRHNSYAQQAQRAVDMSGFDYVTGPSIEADKSRKTLYDDAMDGISQVYNTLVDKGANKQDARGVLPTNIATNIVVKANLRSLHDMALKRLCVKAQGEAQDVFRAMVAEVVKVYPEFKDWLKVWCATYGTCCFPTFPMADCPAKPGVYDPHTQKSYGGGTCAPLDEIERIHRNIRAEAQPG
jgi:flavin-dependent thymidylate synthase